MDEENNNQPIPNKYRGKGKTGLFCPFRTGHYCNPNCGLFMEGLGSCVFHGINRNLQLLNQKEDKKE
jgi:hypothetical protein